MGCGGSKEDVASGNTIRRLLKRKSDVSISEPVTSSSSVSIQETVVSATVIASESVPVDNVAEKVAEPSPPKTDEVKEVEAKVEEKISEEAEEEKVDAKELADDFCTPRRSGDNVSVISRRFGSEGAEYFSPPPEPEAEKIDLENVPEEGTKADDLAVAEPETVAEAVEEVPEKVAEAEAVKEEDTLVSDAVEEPASTPAESGEDGKAESKDVEELKEETEALVEEKEPEVAAMVVEEQTVKDVEKEEKENDSLPQE